MECAVSRTKAFVVVLVGERELVGYYHTRDSSVCVNSRRGGYMKIWD